MSSIVKFGTTGALALMLATAGLGSAPAHAGDRGLGIGLGLAAGLLIGGAIASEHRNHYRHYDYDAAYGPVCYPGPLQWRWQEICSPDGYCHNVRSYFRREICN